ncbi:hypothetical protein ACP70R_011166 [Stipagrostis hirtigluma subsp. patula]
MSFVWRCSGEREQTMTSYVVVATSSQEVGFSCSHADIVQRLMYHDPV